jgi:hypothetical protein
MQNNIALIEILIKFDSTSKCRTFVSFKENQVLHQFNHCTEFWLGVLAQKFPEELEEEMKGKLAGNW